MCVCVFADHQLAQFNRTSRAFVYVTKNAQFRDLRITLYLDVVPLNVSLKVRVGLLSFST